MERDKGCAYRRSASDALDRCWLWCVADVSLMPLHPLSSDFAHTHTHAKKKKTQRAMTVLVVVVVMCLLTCVVCVSCMCGYGVQLCHSGGGSASPGV